MHMPPAISHSAAAGPSPVLEPLVGVGVSVSVPVLLPVPVLPVLPVPPVVPLLSVSFGPEGPGQASRPEVTRTNAMARVDAMVIPGQDGAGDSLASMGRLCCFRRFPCFPDVLMISKSMLRRGRIRATLART